MKDTYFTSVCNDQFQAVYVMMKRCIELCPQELWHDDDETPFWQHAFHALYYCDFYMTPSPAEFVRPTFTNPEQRYLDRSWDTAPEREDLLRYLETVSEKTGAYLRSLADSELELDNPFPGSGPTAGHRLLYILRHIVQHLGWMEEYIWRQANIALGWTSWQGEGRGYDFE